MVVRLFASSENTQGSKETTMQSLQPHLIGAAWSWLGKLEKETIGSWYELAK
jgi:hypothetical protein